MMKKLLMALLIVWCGLAAGVSAANQERASLSDGADGPMQKTKIRVAVNAEFKPFEYYEGDELKGFDVELMDCIGEKIGAEIEFADMAFDELIPAVAEGRADCAISSIAVTEERESVVDFTIPYLSMEVYDEEYGIVFPEGAKTEGQRIYSEMNDAIEKLIDDKTVEKLYEEYELDKHFDMVYGDETGFENGSDNQVSATSVPCSEWAKESVDKAAELNIINYGGNYNYPVAITREEFCELAYNLMKLFSERENVSSADTYIKVTDTQNEAVLELARFGIINGKQENLVASDDETAAVMTKEITFAPDDLLTREEAATILFRLINKMNPEWAAHELYYEFDDSADISEWAMGSIQRICNMGIMNGVGTGKFAPQDNFTTEQAVATLVRVYDGFGVDDAEAQPECLTFADKMNVKMPDNENYMFSPFSIKMALMMVANGAEGETQKEILDALNVENLEDYNKKAREMIDNYSQSDLLKLNVSNSIWINSSETHQRFSEEYKENVAKTFDATADVVNDKNAVDIINGWVNEKTEGKISEIITEDNQDFWAMLINAVYFKGRWEDEFHKGATKKDVFTSKNGSESELDFMNKRDWMNYSKTDGVSIVELPYLTRYSTLNELDNSTERIGVNGIDISMYLMMSDAKFSPEAVLSKANLTSNYIDLFVPKFDIEYSTELSGMLKLIGINKAFEQNAEFYKMLDSGSMWIDSALHKTFIKVDEEGTEAAAVTALAMAGSSMPPEPIELRFDKPFTFVIKDNINGEILFMGEYAFAQ